MIKLWLLRLHNLRKRPGRVRCSRCWTTDWYKLCNTSRGSQAGRNFCEVCWLDVESTAKLLSYPGRYVARLKSRLPRGFTLGPEVHGQFGVFKSYPRRRR